jgi:predicted nucleic acid-binding protein
MSGPCGQHGRAYSACQSLTQIKGYQAETLGVRRKAALRGPPGAGDRLRRHFGRCARALARAESLEDLGQWNKAYSSGLWRVEALRTVDRLRLAQEISDTEVAELVREIQIVHETFTVHPITNQILQRASETFPTVVGTFDAIYLATALSVRQIEPLDSLLTHDSQLGTAAKSLGFHVLGMDQ